MSWGLRVFQLTIEQNSAWGLREGCVDITCPGDESMQLERKKGAVSRPAPFSLRQADNCEELLQAGAASVMVLPTVPSQFLGSLAKGDGLLAL